MAPIESRKMDLQRQVVHERMQCNLEKTAPLDALLRLIEWQRLLENK